MHKITRRLFSGALLVMAAISSPAVAQELKPLKILYTPSPDFAAAQTALQEGIFKKHGLDVNLSQYVASGTTAVNMLVSGSVDITIVSPSVALQTTDAGLDLVIISGGAVLPSDHTWGIFTLKDSGIETAKDLEGKTFGMIITTGSFEIFFNNWMKKNGADPTKVNIVQAPLASMADFLTSKKIDAGIIATPFFEDLVAKTGANVIGNIADALPHPVMINSWGSTREWAEAHPNIVKAFQDSMNEAADFMIANPEKGHQAMLTATGLKPEIVNRTPFSKIQRGVTPDVLSWWYDTMKSRELIVADYDPATLIYRAK
ncbi:ABC transporter substrate-binding protein [Rhizobium sp. Root1204]|uniref:ABC transporter substrate-binding protein n=1 Tax=Rhizobium sp. Root1204 TaxID=1736428 RepID=UPI0007132FF4|nr:ABC transporter substrate-binding protein [Rhizobium sp. Root1204]KQV41303.1 hypothetical protein ASC96_18590 [Rhizobium sp. Root1204]